MKLDDFDAVFRSSVKERFRLSAPALTSSMLITDLHREDADALEETVKTFLGHIGGAELEWRTVAKDEYSSIADILALIKTTVPDLIVSYRHLRRSEANLMYSLGGFIDTLTQATAVPVLLLPSPHTTNLGERLNCPRRVLVVTDHLTGDNRLVNWGVHLCAKDGTLFLAHVEDQATYDHYMEIVGMIPDIDTETTATRIGEKLLDRPTDYVESISEVLRDEGIAEHIVPLVTMGHALQDYKRMVDEHEVDLLVLNTKDANQLAMSGMGYAMAIEINDRPLILL
jgi:hypothetical protein